MRYGSTLGSPTEASASSSRATSSTSFGSRCPNPSGPSPGRKASPKRRPSGQPFPSSTRRKSGTLPFRRTRGTGPPSRRTTGPCRSTTCRGSTGDRRSNVQTIDRDVVRRQEVVLRPRGRRGPGATEDRDQRNRVPAHPGRSARSGPRLYALPAQGAERISEKDLAIAWSADHARILGGFLDLASKTFAVLELGNLTTVDDRLGGLHRDPHGRRLRDGHPCRGGPGRVRHDRRGPDRGRKSRRVGDRYRGVSRGSMDRQGGHRPGRPIRAVAGPRKSRSPPPTLPNG